MTAASTSTALCDLVPAKDGETAGFCDLVSGSFKSAAGAGITAVGSVTNCLAKLSAIVDGTEVVTCGTAPEPPAPAAIVLSVAEATATVTVPAAAVSADSLVFLCWGASGGGDTIASWANSSVHATKIGAAGGSVDFDLEALRITGAVRVRVFVAEQTIELLGYIQSSGAQWIDTSVVSAWGDVYEIEVATTALNQSDAYFAGEFENTYTDRGRYQVTLWQDDNQVSQCVGGSGGNGMDPALKAGTVSLDTFYTVVSDFTKGNRKLELYDADKSTLVGSDTTTQVVRQDIDNTGDCTICLMAANRGGAAESMTRGNFKYSYFKLTRGGEVVKNLVAAKDGSKIGMYDTVSGTFIENGSTGVFTYGSFTGRVPGTVLASSSVADYDCGDEPVPPPVSAE